MNTTAPEQTHENCIPTWHGLHIERATILRSDHIATVCAAVAGIHAVVNVLHDRESQRYTGEATHCPTKNMGLLAAVHSLATLVQMHTAKSEEDEPDFIRDEQGLQELRSAADGHWVRATAKQWEIVKWAQQQAQQHPQPQPNPAPSHTQQAQAATEKVAPKPARRTASTSTQPMQKGGAA